MLLHFKALQGLLMKIRKTAKNLSSDISVIRYPENNILGVKTVLRKLEQRDLEKSMVWLKDPSINMFLSHDFNNLTIAQEKAWFDFLQDSKSDMVFAVLDKIDLNHIGNCALHKIDLIKHICEIGIVIGEKKYWNRGFGPDAIKSIIRFSFKDLGLSMLRLNVYCYNKRAIKAYEKCGFTKVKVLEKNHFYDDKYWDTLVMECSKDGR